MIIEYYFYILALILAVVFLVGFIFHPIRATAYLLWLAIVVSPIAIAAIDGQSLLIIPAWIVSAIAVASVALK